MSPPTPAEVEHAEWPALKAYAVKLGLNPKGRSAVVRRRILDHLRSQGGAVEWRAGRGEQAALLTRLGLADVAASLWESTISLDAPAPWVGLGTAYLRAKRLPEAMKCYDRAIGLGDPVARLHKAHAHMQAGKSDAALAEVEEAINSNAGDVRAWVRRAALAEASGRTDEAVASWARLVELGRGRLGLARVLMRAGHFEDAGKALEAHLGERPGDALAWNNLGACLARRGLWEKALDAFRRASALDTHDAGILNNLGVALAATGRREEGLRRLEAARRIAEDPRILLNEAALMERQRTPAAAREAYERVLEVAPAHPEAVAGKRRVAPKRRARKVAAPRPVARRVAERRPATKVVRKPAKVPVKVPARRQVRTPARRLAKKPTMKAAREPVRKPAGPPAKKVVRKPAKVPVKIPARRPVRKAVKRPAKRPARKSAKAPAKRPAKRPAMRSAKPPAKKAVRARPKRKAPPARRRKGGKKAARPKPKKRRRR